MWLAILLAAAQATTPAQNALQSRPALATAQPPMPAGAVGIGRPAGLAFDDDGGLYVAAPDLGRVLRVSPNGLVTVAAERNDASSIAWARGELYVAGGDEGPIDRLLTASATLEAAVGIVGTRVVQAAGMTMHPDGALFVVDRAAHCVYRITRDGRFVQVVGDGIPGFQGDGGPASVARLSGPEGLALDRHRSLLFVADRGNHSVRRVDLRSGLIDTVVGTEIEGEPGEGTVARSAPLRDPVGVAVDSRGNLYVSDVGCRSVYRVDSAGILRRLPLPAGAVAGALGVDAADALVLSDTAGRRVWRCARGSDCRPIAGDGGLGFTGDGGPATSAYLMRPVGLARDANGNLFIADEGAHRVRRVDARSRAIETFAGNGIPGFSADGEMARGARLNRPAAIAIDAVGNVLIADTGNHRVRRVSADGRITTILGTGADGWPRPGDRAETAKLGRPDALFLARDGALLVVQRSYGLVHRLLQDGRFETLTGLPNEPRIEEGQAVLGRALGNLRAVAPTADGGLVYAEERGERLCRLDGEGLRMRVLAGVVAATDARPGQVRAFPDVSALCVDGRGIVRAGGHAVGLLTIQADGRVGANPAAAERFREPAALLCGDEDDSAYVADASGAIWRIAADGSLARIAGRGPGF